MLYLQLKGFIESFSHKPPSKHCSSKDILSVDVDSLTKNDWTRQGRQREGKGRSQETSQVLHTSVEALQLEVHIVGGGGLLDDLPATDGILVANHAGTRALVVLDAAAEHVPEKGASNNVII